MIVKVPATTANLGPGFDVLGMALSRYSTFECDHSDKIEVEIRGIESHKIDSNDNLVLDCMEKLFKEVGKRPKGYRLVIDNGIPLARGMGSSAAAIVGGLVCANWLLDNPLNENELLSLATEIEGHPDNVAPALLGDLIISTTMDSGEVVYRKITPFEDMTCVLFIPEYEVSTSDSRGVLPLSYTMKDIVKNSSNLSLMVLGFMTEDVDLISKTMNDVIHEPYRKKLIKGFDELKVAAIDNGAISYSLSGAGSTVISYCRKKDAEKIRQAFEEVAKEKNIVGEAVIINPCREGINVCM